MNRKKTIDRTFRDCKSSNIVFLDGAVGTIVDVEPRNASTEEKM